MTRGQEHSICYHTMEPDKNPIYFGLKPAPGPTRQYSARNRSDPTVFSSQPTRPDNVEPAPVRGSDRVGFRVGSGRVAGLYNDVSEQ
jgi:hypothetical protein